MTLESTPWLVGGGAEHSAGVARTVAYAATGGKSGIAAPGDLKVAAQPVANGSVRVLPGVATLVNTYPGGNGQAYVARNLSQTNVTIAPTGSASGRSDLLVMSITDSEFEGSAPADPNAFEYTRLEVISGVSSTTSDLTGLSFPRPAIALARIDLPASTGTITSGMVKDLRNLANPRRERELTTAFPSGTVEDGTAHKVGSAGYSVWPLRPAERPVVFVPEWASRLQIVVHISGLQFEKNTSAFSRIGLRTGISVDGSENGIAVETNTGRHHYTVVGSHYISPELRGTLQTLTVQAVQTAGNGGFYADYQTSVSFDYEFSESLI